MRPSTLALLVVLLGCGSPDSTEPPTPADETVSTGDDHRVPPDEDADPVGDVLGRIGDDDPSDPDPVQPDPVQPSPGEVFRHSDNRPRHDAGRLARLGIERYASRRLVLYTDVEPKVARTLPPLVDAAYEQWVAYFGELPPDRERSEFQVTGYLMRDERRFEDAGLVPADLPRFLNGRHRDYEFWMYDQEHPYYRRHLLLHEATHCFTTCLPNVRMPVWYLEGIAELFATHRFVAEGGTRIAGTEVGLETRVMPDDEEAFFGLGRISLIQRAVSEHRALTLAEVGALEIDAYLKPDAYAWVWTAAAFFDGHPRYRDRFRELGRKVVVEEAPFETVFADLFDPDRSAIDAEWPVFVAGLRTGYDLEWAAITFRPGRPTTGATCDVRADRGWQSTEVLVEKGTTYEVTAKGRFTLGDEPRPWISEANGVSLRFVDGRRIGRLLATIDPTDPADRPNGMLSVTPLGNAGLLKPTVTGTLYLRLNDDWAELADNRGEVEVSIRPTSGSSKMD